jgi:hypothetical protein
MRERRGRSVMGSVWFVVTPTSHVTVTGDSRQHGSPGPGVWSRSVACVGEWVLTRRLIWLWVSRRPVLELAMAIFNKAFQPNCPWRKAHHIPAPARVHMLSLGKSQIRNSKFQITNKFKIRRLQIQNVSGPADMQLGRVCYRLKRGKRSGPTFRATVAPGCRRATAALGPGPK